MKMRMTYATLVLLLTLGCVIGCGKAETASTDTAVTETVAPESVATATGDETGTPATDSATTSDSELQEAPPSSKEGEESGEN